MSAWSRQRVFSYYFGQLDEAGRVLRLHGANFLQNLFGEGVLSASFIPVYSRLLAMGIEEADRVPAPWAQSRLAASIIVVVGVVCHAVPDDRGAPGYIGAKRELTIRLVRILFRAGLLVASAWSLGILNSHRKFFLSYGAGDRSDSDHDPVDQFVTSCVSAWDTVLSAS